MSTITETPFAPITNRNSVGSFQATAGEDSKVSWLHTRAILSLISKWKQWYHVLHYRKGFGLFDSVRLGLWLARG
jgi:hypothetical protein